MAQFGEILAELRQDRGLTQRDLAKLFFVTPGTISNYEKGRHLPDRGTADKNSGLFFCHY